MNNHLNESEFHRLADATLEGLLNRLEQADEQGVLDVESQNGVLTIDIPTGQQYVVSKHAPSRQLWLSSPISGGLHFDYNAESKDWQLKDGKKLMEILFAELEKLAGIKLL